MKFYPTLVGFQVAGTGLTALVSHIGTLASRGALDVTLAPVYLVSILTVCQWLVDLKIKELKMLKKSSVEFQNSSS